MLCEYQPFALSLVRSPGNEPKAFTPYESLRGDDLLDAPADAIAGISANDRVALARVHIRTVRNLAESSFVRAAQSFARLEGVEAAATAVTSGLTGPQKQLFAALTDKVSSTLGNQLDGTYKNINYPHGFPYATQVPPSNYYNPATIAVLDKPLIRASNGILARRRPKGRLK